MHNHRIYHAITLEPEEKILFEVRRHMFVFYSRILFIVALFFIPILISPLIILGLNKALGGNGETLFGFLLALWLLFLWNVFFIQWIDYYLDMWVITNKRIFDIEQKGLFSQEVSIFNLERIQDLTVEVRGVIATFFKFGNIHIHTAGEGLDFIIKDASHPMDVKNLIMAAHAEAIKK